jgi:hypothetical protein
VHGISVGYLTRKTAAEEKSGTIGGTLDGFG